MTTDFKCGCKIMTDTIRLNKWEEPYWTFHMKTYANVCGRHALKQQKFQLMENKLLEMEKARMRMFTEDAGGEEEQEEPEVEVEDEDDDEPPYEELKAYLKTMNQTDREQYQKFETLRNLANGYPPNHKMKDIYKAIKELQKEEEQQ